MEWDQLPPCRPLGLHVTDPSSSLSFALTIEPDNENTELPDGQHALGFDVKTLHQAAEALAATDVSYLQPQVAPKPFYPEAGSLEAKLMALKPASLSLEPAAAGHQHHVQATKQQGQGAMKPHMQVLDGQTQANQQQQQQQQQQQHVTETGGKQRRTSAPAATTKHAAAAETAGPADGEVVVDAVRGAHKGPEQQVPERRHKQRVSAARATTEEFVGQGIDQQQAAADATEAISSFLLDYKRLVAEQREAGADGMKEASDAEDDSAENAQAAVNGQKANDAAEEGATRPFKRRKGAQNAPPGQQQRRLLQRPFIPLRWLQRLGAALSQARGAHVVALVDAKLLGSLLAALQGHVELGIDKVVTDDEQPGSPAFDAVAVALEAAACCLQVLSAPGLPMQLYLEELVTGLVTLVKFHLQYNLLVLYDIKYRRLYRPSSMSMDPEDPEGTAKAKGASAKKRQKIERQSSVPKLSRALAALQGRVELLLSLLSCTLGRCRFEPELLLPLGRVAMQMMALEGGGEGLALLQLQAAGLVTSLFRHCHGHRSSFMSEFLTHVIGQLGAGGKVPPRPCIAGLGAGQQQVCVQVATAAIVRMVQASVSLPPLDAPPDAARACYSAAAIWAGAFWDGVFDLLPAARAAKSDSAQDTRAVVEGLLTDLLALQCLPDWPAANVLLRLFAKALSGPKGLSHTDTGVKALCVDFTGHLVKGICHEALKADEEAKWVEDLVALVQAEQREKQRARAISDDDAGPPSPEPDDLDGEASAARRTATLQRVLLESMGAWGRPRGLAPGAGDDEDNSAGGGGGGCAASARRFLACQMMHDALLAAAKQHGLQRRGSAGSTAADVPQEEVLQLLVAHRAMLDAVSGGLLSGLFAADGAPLTLDAAQAARVARRMVVEGPLGAGRATMLGWLVEAGNRQRQDANAAQVRAKAVKCIGTAAEIDLGVLGMAEVQRGVATALQDDSVSVREAAIEILAKHLVMDPALAEEYFEVLAEASRDPGVSVRKRAVKALWECCEHCQGFTRRTDAVVAILQRTGDPEESMRQLVMRLCADMWFAPGASGEAEHGKDSGAQHSAAQRAADLSEVALAVYEAGGKAIHLPLTLDHPLVSVISAALGAGAVKEEGARGGGGAAAGGKAIRKGASEVAGALLAQVVQLPASGDGSGGGGDGGGMAGEGARFSRLLALHALSAAEPPLVVPARDPQRFVRSLAPYATAPDAETVARQRGAADEQRRGAEELLCLLAVLQAGTGQLNALAAPVAAQLTRDLANITSKHMFTPVVASATCCLCSLSRLDASVGPLVGTMARKMFDVVETALAPPMPADPALEKIRQQACIQLPRVIFLLGQLCRFGADLMDEAAAIGAAAAPPARPPFAGGAAPSSAAPPTAMQCLELFTRVWNAKRLGAKALDMALQAMGLLFIARPSLILSEGSSAADVYREALHGGGGPAMRMRVLSNLVELLRSDEESMLASQKAADVATAAAQQASTMPAPARAALQRQNGEGDSGHLSSGLLQGMWNEVLSLAVEAPPASGAVAPSPPRTPGGTAAASPEAAAAALRRKALELIEVVLRGGHVAPWTAVAPLMALCTDPAPDTRSRALRVLKLLHDKYPDFTSDRLAPAGMVEAHRLHARLWAASHPGVPAPPAPKPEALRGLGEVYAELVQGDNKLKARFLHKLLAPFSEVASASAAASHAGAGHASTGGAPPPLAARRASGVASNGGAVPFSGASPLHGAGGSGGLGGAAPDASLLFFCAHVAASLPARRADEPLLLLHHIGDVVRHQAGGALERLRTALLRAGLKARLLAAGKGALDEEDLILEDEGGAAHAAAAANGGGAPEQQQHHASGAAAAANGGAHHGPLPAPQRADRQQHQQHPLGLPPHGELLAAAGAGLGIAALLVLKQFLMAAYWLSDERVAEFEPKGEKKRAEEKGVVARNQKVSFTLSVLDPLCLQDATGDLLAKLFVTLKGLMDQDATCRAIAAGAPEGGAPEGEGGAEPPQGGGGGAGAPGGAAEGAAAVRGHRRSSAAAVEGTPMVSGAKPGKGLVVFSADAQKPPRGGGGSTRGKGRGSSARGGRGGPAGRGRGRGAGKRRKGKYSADDDGESEDDDYDGGDSGDDGDYEPAKQLF